MVEMTNANWNWETITKIQELPEVASNLEEFLAQFRIKFDSGFCCSLCFDGFPLFGNSDCDRERVL